MNTMSEATSEARDPSGNCGCTLLIAEDNLGDYVLLTRTLTKMNVRCAVVRVQNGREAIDYLEACGPAPRNPCPSHFILDLKMPIVGGFEVLEWLRAHDQYASLPVIVMSSSAIDSDMLRAQGYGIDAYLVKPAGLDELAHMVGQIREIWNLPHGAF